MIEQLAALETEALPPSRPLPTPPASSSPRRVARKERAQLTALLKGLRHVAPAERGAVGKAANVAKQRLLPRPMPARKRCSTV